MKLSEIDPKSLTNEELWDIVGGDIADDQDRLEAASDFYLSEGHSLDELIAVNV